MSLFRIGAAVMRQSAGGTFWRSGSVAPNFFISPTGSDSNSGTSQLSPWAITAINTKRATYRKQRVGLMDGVYDVNAMVNANVSASQPTLNIEGGDATASTIIQSVNTRGATITAKSGSNYAGNGGINFETGTPIIGNNFLYGATPGYVVIDGLRLTGCAGTLILFGQNDSSTGVTWTDNVAVQNCELFDTNAAILGFGGNPGAVSTNCARFGRFENNYVHDIVGRLGTSVSDHVQAFISWGSQNLTYRKNTIVRAGGSGIYAKIASQPVYGGLIEQNHIDASMYSDGPIGGIQDYLGDVPVQAGTALIARNNIIISSRPIDIRRGSTPQRNQTEDIQVYNNTLVYAGSTDAPYFISVYAYSPGPKIYNNLCVGAAAAMSEIGVVLLPSGLPALMDFNIYPLSSTHWSTFLNGGNAYPDTGYTLAQWQARLVDLHSILSDTTAFLNVGTSAQRYQLSGAASAAWNAGRIGGLSGGAQCHVGAWDGLVTQIGASFAA